MFELTNHQLSIITSDVEKADISFSHLQLDLIDHICCDLEHEMSLGLSFEKAYEVVKAKIGIRGLQQIQEDTLFLTDKNYRHMKKTMKISGVISPIMLAFAGLFKIQHLPGASVLLTLGFFVMIFVFLPSAIYVSYREVSNRTKLFMHLAGFFSGFLFALSFLFKIQHWPGTSIMMFAAASITGLFFIPAVFINQMKTRPRNESVCYSIGLIGSIIYLMGFLFKINHWEGASLLVLTGSLLLLLIAFPWLMFKHYRNHEHVSSKFIFIIFAVVWFIVPTIFINQNVSENVKGGFRKDASESAMRIQYLTSQNNKLFATIMERDTSNTSTVKPIATTIKKNADALYDYIQHLKLTIIGLSTVKPAEPNAIPDVSAIGDQNADAAQQVLFRDGEAAKLKHKIEFFRDSVIQTTEFDEAAVSMIKEILSTSVPENEIPEAFKDWEQYSLKASMLTTAIKNLNDLQEKVCLAELMALRSLNKKNSTPVLLAKSGK